MNRFSFLLRLLAAVALVVAPVTVVSANTATGPVPMKGLEFSEWAEYVVLNADGSADVRIEFTMEFDQAGSRGPYLTFLHSQKYDSDRNRIYQFSNWSASSPTGAPAYVTVEQEGSFTIVKIGDPDYARVVGTQKYELSFKVDGLLNPASSTGGGDELYWNVIGSGFEVPLSKITILVQTAAGEPQQVGCWVGQGSTQECDVKAANPTTATFQQATLNAGEPMTIAVAYPAGTFPTAKIKLQDNNPFRAAFAFTPLNVGGGIATLVGGLGIAGWALRRHGRDEQYYGLTPGLTPPPNADVQIGPRRKRPVAVQFTPPKGFHVGAIGTLLDEVADSVDITASMVDLAVRGYLTITPEGDSKASDNFRLRRTDKPIGDLDRFDQYLMDSLFADGDDVWTEDLDYEFTQRVSTMRDLLYQDVMGKGWFRRNPSTVRNSWMALGGMILTAGLGLGTWAVTAFSPFGIICLALVILGIVLFSLSGRAPARTAKGTAILDQTLGFKTYMATAEANQIRFEAGEDVFSKYMPYAIVFGLVDRWTAIFAELAAAGVYTPSYGYWYIGGNMHSFADGSFSRSIENFGTATATAMTQPTPGSGGGSAFGGGFGGGGFGGGGVGGGGGGSW